MQVHAVTDVWQSLCLTPTSPLSGAHPKCTLKGRYRNKAEGRKQKGTPLGTAWPTDAAWSGLHLPGRTRREGVRAAAAGGVAQGPPVACCMRSGTTATKWHMPALAPGAPPGPGVQNGRQEPAGPSAQEQLRPSWPTRHWATCAQEGGTGPEQHHRPAKATQACWADALCPQPAQPLTSHHSTWELGHRPETPSVVLGTTPRGPAPNPRAQRSLRARPACTSRIPLLWPTLGPSHLRPRHHRGPLLLPDPWPYAGPQPQSPTCNLPAQRSVLLP